MDDDYLKVGLWFAIPTFLIVWLLCFVHAVGEYDWFLGIPLGFFIGGFFASIAGLIALYLWPLIAIAIGLFIYAIYSN